MPKAFASLTEPDTKETVQDGATPDFRQRWAALSPQAPATAKDLSQYYSSLAIPIPPSWPPAFPPNAQTPAAGGPKDGGTPARTKEEAQKPAASNAPEPPPAAKPDGGAKKTREATITASATVDIGGGCALHTERTSPTLGPGRQNEVFGGQNEGRSGCYAAENIAQQSSFGVQGEVPVSGHSKVIFTFRDFFNPLSLKLTDGPGSLAQASGVPAADQRARADSSVAGQPFNGLAFAGVSLLDGKFTATAGRQASLASQTIGKYDPQSGSYVGSLPAYFTSVAGGTGTSELTIWDNALKAEDNKIHIGNLPGDYRISAMYAPGGNAHANHGNAFALNWGYSGDFTGTPLGFFSVDAAYTNVKDAVSGASLPSVPAGFPAAKSLAGTISGNTAWTAGASSTYPAGRKGKLTISALAQEISVRPPGTPVAAGSTTAGGYFLATVNNNPAPRDVRLLGGGASYKIDDHWTLAAAAYDVHQKTTVSGDGYLVSASVKYDFNKYLSAGFIWNESWARGGLLPSPGPGHNRIAAVFVQLKPSWTGKFPLPW